MIIQELTLRNFRNYEETRLTPHEGVNLFFGANGSGKTNLLEAIHYCALGKSHRIIRCGWFRGSRIRKPSCWIRNRSGVFPI